MRANEGAAVGVGLALASYVVCARMYSHKPQLYSRDHRHVTKQSSLQRPSFGLGRLQQRRPMPHLRPRIFSKPKPTRRLLPRPRCPQQLRRSLIRSGRETYAGQDDFARGRDYAELREHAGQGRERFTTLVVAGYVRVEGTLRR
jgi:hypothetical protein